MITRLTLTLSALILLACHQPSASQQRANVTSSIVNKNGNTIEQRFSTPLGYKRVVADDYGKYLRNLTLKKDGANVHLYDGGMKGRQDAHAAVVNIDVGDKNLQQCADAIMRLRAEYFYQQKQYNKIHFKFTNGFIAYYGKWKEGYRISVKGNDVSWVRSSYANGSYNSFRSYLDMVFSYAGTLSLSRELQTVPFNNMQIGDVLIQGGSPGHAVVVVDMAIDTDGNKLFMLAQSYMPAQEIHVLKNLENEAISPWYSINDIRSNINTPEWTFTTNDLKRFIE